VFQQKTSWYLVIKVTFAIQQKMKQHHDVGLCQNRKFGMASNAKNGRAVPNTQIAGKIGRALDVRLPRPGGMAVASKKDGVAVTGAKKKLHLV
jgi:hypothetical protein